MRIMVMGVGIYPYEVGGAQTHMYHTARQLVVAGHEVCAVVLWRSNSSVMKGASSEVDGLKLFRISIPSSLWDFALDASGEASASLKHLLLSAMDIFQPQVLHLFRFSPGSQAFLALITETTIPIVLTALGFKYFCTKGPLMRGRGICNGLISGSRCAWCLLSRGWGWDSALTHTLGRFAMGKVGYSLLSAHEKLKIDRVTEVQNQWHKICSSNLHIIAPCQMLERLCIENGFHSQRIMSMTYGIPDDLISKRPEKTPSGRIRFAYLGKISAYKGVILAVHAAYRAAQVGAEFSLHIYGELDPKNDAYHRSVLKAVKNHVWPSNVEVRLMGRYEQEQLPEIHSKTDVFVFTSLWPENATITVLESLALGTPVLASAVEGVTEFIRQDENGWHYPRGDVKALAKAMIKLAKQPAGVHKAAGAARPVLAMSKMAQRLVRLYQSLQG